MGWQETITYVFTSDEQLARAHAPEAAVRLESPPSAERSVLRTTLYPGLLNAAAANRAAERLALFEIGRVFGEGGGGALGSRRAGAVGGRRLAGRATPRLLRLQGRFGKPRGNLGAEVKLEPHPHPPCTPA